jgi:adenine phosphoribosyltransferase
MDLARHIRTIPDFPEPGILFRDITPLLARPEALAAAVEGMVGPFHDERIAKVVGIESRGFMFGAPVAIRLGAGFVPARKPGKLPAERVSEAYELEYGTAALELHRDAVAPGERVLVVDDVIATGGTMAAAVALVQRLGGVVVACGVLVELEGLAGRRRLGNLRLESLVRYP